MSTNPPENADDRTADHTTTAPSAQTTDNSGDHSADEHDHLTWRRVHPLSPLANTWKVFATLFAVIIWHNADDIGQAVEEGKLTADNLTKFLPYVALGLAVILLAVGLYSWIAWKRMAFAIGNQAVWFRRGIIFRSERHSRLDRIQSVDITHPLIGRLFGLGNLNITVAGGNDSTLTIGLLTSSLMADVQQEIMDRVYQASDAATLDDVDQVHDQPLDRAVGGTVDDVAKGAAVGTAGSLANAAAGRTVADDTFDSEQPAITDTGQNHGTHTAGVESAVGDHATSNTADQLGIKPAPAGPAADGTTNGGVTGASSTNRRANSTGQRDSQIRARRDHPHIPVFEVSTSRLLASIAVSGLFLFSLVWFVIALTLVIVLFRYFEEASLVAMVTTVGALVIGFLSSFWSKLSNEFGFRAELSADGIHVKHGLTATVAETIPPRRIHAVEIKQSWLWRRFGWYRVEMTVAGKSVKEMLESSTLLPVGTLQEALLAVWLVEPDLGVADPAHMMTVAMGPDGAASVLTAAKPTASGQHTAEIGGQPPLHVNAEQQISADIRQTPADDQEQTPHPYLVNHDQAQEVSASVASSNQGGLTMLTSPASAKLFDPFTWQRNATLLTDTVLMHRGGWLTRYISVVPLGHVQSWKWHQGPWERKRGLARIQPNLVMGSVTVDSAHLEQRASQNLMQALSGASEQARESESRADWSNRIQALQLR